MTYLYTCTECGVTNPSVVLHDGGHESPHPSDVSNVALCAACDARLTDAMHRDDWGRPFDDDADIETDD